jgi:hypothetical protein
MIRHAVFTVAAVLSIIGLCTVAFSIYSNKALRDHPSPLIANICIAESIMCWASYITALDRTN